MMTLNKARLLVLTAGVLLLCLIFFILSILPPVSFPDQSVDTFFKTVFGHWKGGVGFILVYASLAISCGLILGSFMSWPKLLFSRDFYLMNIVEVFNFEIGYIQQSLLSIAFIAILYFFGLLVGIVYVLILTNIYIALVTSNLVRLYFQNNAYRFDFNYRTTK